MRILLSLACLLTAAARLSRAMAVSNAASTQLKTTLPWEALPTLPHELVVAGPFVGVHSRHFRQTVSKSIGTCGLNRLKGTGS